jgi:hypothetical protein
MQALKDEERKCIFQIIDAFKARNKIKRFAQEIT